MVSPPHLPRVVILMGVSGSGKTVVGEALARATGWRFVDSDDLHPPENRAKMSAGIPLTDADRQPWLERIRRGVIDATPGGDHCIIACSALRRAYRDLLTRDAGDVRIVLLDGTREQIAERLTARQGHFMPASLLDSQLATLERPADGEAIAVPVTGTPEAIADEILARLGASAGSAGTEDANR